VYSFTLDADSFVEGSISGSYAGMHITSDCVDTATECAASATGSGGGTISSTLLSAGTYFLTVSSWPSPQNIDFTLNFSASAAVEGCMDANADNYDANANMSCADCCTYSLVQGCMDASACNYDSAAEADDGTCVLPGDSIDCTLALGDGASGDDTDFGKWYSFSVPEGTLLNTTVSACGTAFDTKLWVYDSAGADAGYNDDGCSGFGSGSSYASELVVDGGLAAATMLHILDHIVHGQQFQHGI
jgi:hypothetical protein